ncbi:wax ester/triacylglycerol synthase domain-containing protein [Mycobacterium sp.]|uniref:wax ester/triacylglycerol synthase domain-containing protein n=1 Tax=Mycobacterium sp. TaxID=1785 RepID=UPI002C96CD00|nr:wax ester/triacylglycerol synthase domain-containing protein [Mycobacterium sp.]HTQ17159.1 wax ester/triacylglycerol synthase domain-containing protein [Mycobacterium sp.]
MVTRLSKADAMRMLLENSAIPAHTVSVIVIEPSDRLSHQRIHRMLGSSLPQLARFRSRLVGKPLGMGQPLWAQIDDYDPASQIHSATIDAPGGPREFDDFIAQLSTRPYGRPETLWEAWSIDGLTGGHWAVAVKMSPALDDGGVGAVSMWSRLLRSGSPDDPAKGQLTQPSLGTLRPRELVIDTMTELVENYVSGLWLAVAALSDLLQVGHRQWRGTSEPDPTPAAVSSMSGPVPHNVFNAPLTERRAVAFASISLADLRAVSYAFGGTVTNVLLASCTMSLRAWLQRHDNVPDHPLLIQMPFALSRSNSITFGDPLGSMGIRIPVQLDDPVQVLTNLHTAAECLNIARTHDCEKDCPSFDLTHIAALLPPAVVRAGIRLYAASGIRQRHRASCHGTLSFVSGQPAPAYCGGAKVVGMHTVAPLREGCGLGITLTARGDAMDVSVCVCPDNVPAVGEIATGMAESVDMLLAAAEKSPRGQGRSVVTRMTSHVPRGSRSWHP